MVRKPSQARASFPDHPHLSFVQGDLEEISVVKADLVGVDAVIHAAALFTEYYLRAVEWSKFEKLNVNATLTLFKLAKEAGVKKGVFVSSVGALADRNDTLLDENTLSDFYRKSKVLGEKALNSEPSLKGFPIITIRPSWIFGPNDHAPTTTGRMTQELVQKKSTSMVTGDPLSVVDARDVALAIALAVEKVDSSESFNLSGAEIGAADCFKLIAKHIPGSKVMVAPFWAGMLVGNVLQVWTNLSGGINPMPPEGLKFLSKGPVVDASKSKELLGLQYRFFEVTARDVAQYWLGQK